MALRGDFFRFEPFCISPPEIQPNQQVEISVDVGNTGETTGSYAVLLYVNGNVEDSYTSRISQAQLRMWSLCEPVGSRHLFGIAAGLRGQSTVVATPSVSPPMD